MYTQVLFAGIGGPEVLLIVLVVLLFFGAKRIPDLMKGLGKGVKSFKEGINGIEKEINADPAEEKKDKEPAEKEK